MRVETVLVTVLGGLLILGLTAVAVIVFTTLGADCRCWYLTKEIVP